MYSNSDSSEILSNDEADEVIKRLFDLLKNRYQNKLESMKGSEFVFEYVQILYDKCHKINPSCDESSIDSPNWMKNEKTRNKSNQ